MDTRTPSETVFLENLQTIDRASATLARRYGITGEDAVDFASWIRLKLIEDDYGVFRDFRGESSLLTYLSVVIAMLARDYRVQRWGRWRPSAEARRQGTIAVRLETLVHQRGYRFDEAAELLRTTGETDLANGELARILARLPARQPIRPVEVGTDALMAFERPDDALRRSGFESIEERQRTRVILEDVIGELPQEDRIVVKLRFWEGSSVAEIARSLRLDQKRLYRRLDHLLDRLKERLVARGIDREEVFDLLREVES